MLENHMLPQGLLVGGIRSQEEYLCRFVELV
jgi:hypothetical protein